MRVSDIFRLKWSDFQNYRLQYSMSKNDETGSFKVPNKARLILKHYKLFKVNNDDLVFLKYTVNDLIQILIFIWRYACFLFEKPSKMLLILKP